MITTTRLTVRWWSGRNARANHRKCPSSCFILPINYYLLYQPEERHELGTYKIESEVPVFRRHRASRAAWRSLIFVVLAALRICWLFSPRRLICCALPDNVLKHHQTSPNIEIYCLSARGSTGFRILCPDFSDHSGFGMA
jgi:hypothetical protein